MTCNLANIKVVITNLCIIQFNPLMPKDVVMQSQTFSQTVRLPGVDDFLKKYPRYTKFATGEGRFLFDLIMQPEALIRAQVLADFNLPSVLSVAEDCRLAIDKNASALLLNSFTKQFIGAAICVLMEANDFQKTGIKKSVPHQSFSIGEFYKRV